MSAASLVVAAGAWISGMAAAQDAARGVPVELPRDTEGLALLDWDGDGRQELLVARPNDLMIATLARDGGLTTLHAIDRGSSRTLAWCVDESVRPAALLTVREDGLLQRHRAGQAPQEAARVAGIALPGGVYAFPFARDLDGDGDQDFALPAARGLELWFVGADGVAKRGPTVRQRVDQSMTLAAPEDDRPVVAASVAIPAFDVVDQNGDGRADLVFESDDRLQFFWTRPDGSLPEAPTVELDLDELKKKLDAGPRGVLDPANLFKAFSGSVSAEVRDLDGDAKADLLLRQGSKVSLYAGGPQGIDRAKAAQVLKVSGNLLLAFARDDNGDGKEDLCLLQVADVSIGQVLLWVIVGGNLEFDCFTYFQEATLRFSKSPSRRRRLVVELPALLGLQDELEESPVVKRLAGEFLRVPVGLDLDGDGVRGDVADLQRDGVIALHRGKAALSAAGDPTFATLRAELMARFDRVAAGKEVVKIELMELVDWVPTPGSALRATIAGKTATRLLGLPDPSAVASQNASRIPQTDRLLVTADLDGDKKDDLLLLDRDPLTLEVFWAE